MSKPKETSGLPEQPESPTGQAPAATSEMEFSSPHKEVLALMGWFYLINGKYDLSVNLLTALHRIDPFGAATIKMLCYSWLRSGSYSKALLYSELLLEISFTPQEISVANMLKSRALWAVGRHEEANELMQLVVATKKEMLDVSI